MKKKGDHPCWLWCFWRIRPTQALSGKLALSMQTSRGLSGNFVHFQALSGKISFCQPSCKIRHFQSGVRKRVVSKRVTLRVVWQMFPYIEKSSKKSFPECTKIAHRHSPAIFAADSGIAGNSAAGIKFVPFNCRENRRSLAIFLTEQIAPLGASKNRAILRGSGKIAAATAENRAILVHSGPSLQCYWQKKAMIFVSLDPKPERGYIRPNHPFTRPPFCFLSKNSESLHFRNPSVLISLWALLKRHPNGYQNA